MVLPRLAGCPNSRAQARTQCLELASPPDVFAASIVLAACRRGQEAPELTGRTP